MAVKAIDRVALLFDFYGPLLTPRQQELVRSYYLDDLSLGEIAEAERVSRQAVYDQIRRAEAQLAEFEARLGLVAEHQRCQQVLARAAGHLAAALAQMPAGPAAAEVQAALAAIQSLLAEGASEA